MEKILQKLKDLRQEDPEAYELSMTSVYYPYSRECPAQSAREYEPHQTRIYVTERDCLEASSVMATLESSGHPLVLNMANAHNCGGGFDGPRGSQEEYLIRNTSLIASLWPHRRPDDNRWLEGQELFSTRSHHVYYPLTNCGVIYSPSVRVFNFCHQCDVISLAQQDLRTNRPYSSGASFDYQLTLQNFRSLFSVALAHGHTTLILGAIGCGAFQNPPEEICQAFAELIFPGGEFYNVFETIVFAVIKSAANLTAFENAFGEKVELESILFPDESEEDEGEDDEEEEEGEGH